MPIDISDFPFIVGQALTLHSQLADRYATTELGLLYLGKDLITLPLLFKYNNIPERDEEFLLQLIQHIDIKPVKKSAANIKAASDKLKRSRSKK